MKPTYKPTKRKRTSQFDPYTEIISDMVNGGSTVVQIADALEPYFDDVVSPDSLYTFMKRRGLQLKNGGNNSNAPKCANCNEYMKALAERNRTVSVCMKSKRVICRSAVTSPIWCERRLQHEIHKSSRKENYHREW